MARDTLPQALDSLVAQTKKMFIVTIVQDCDGQDYSDIVEEYKRRGLHIRHVSTPENLGPGGARQYGMDIEKMCDYVMFLDADDMLCPRAIEVLYREAKLKNADLISSSFMAEQMHEPGVCMDVESTPATWTHGKIYKLEYLRKNNIRFLKELRLNEDSYFNLVAVNCTKNKFKIKETTYIWRDNINSLTRNQEDEGFFKKSWEQYIFSQTQGLLDIERIYNTMPPALIAMTLNNMYMQMMEAIFYKYSLDNAKKISLRLKDCKALQQALETKEFWQTINNVVKGSILKKNSLIFFKMRFCDWLNEFILDKEKLDI